MKFQGISLGGGQALKSGGEAKTPALADGLPRGQWQTAAGITGKNSLTQWIVLFSSWLQKRRDGKFVGETNQKRRRSMLFIFFLMFL